MPIELTHLSTTAYIESPEDLPGTRVQAYLTNNPSPHPPAFSHPFPSLLNERLVWTVSHTGSSSNVLPSSNLALSGPSAGVKAGSMVKGVAVSGPVMVFSAALVLKRKGDKELLGEYAGIKQRDAIVVPA